MINVAFLQSLILFEKNTDNQPVIDKMNEFS